MSDTTTRLQEKWIRKTAVKFKNFQKPDRIVAQKSESTLVSMVIRVITLKGTFSTGLWQTMNNENPRVEYRTGLWNIICALRKQTNARQWHESPHHKPADYSELLLITHRQTNKARTARNRELGKNTITKINNTKSVSRDNCLVWTDGSGSRQWPKIDSVVTYKKKHDQFSLQTFTLATIKHKKRDARYTKHITNN